MRHLGLDPGLIGGAAVIETAAPFDSPVLLDAIEIPIVGHGAKQRLHAVYLLNWIRKWNPERAWIERAQAMPDQGASSGFIYGRVTGALETVVVLAGVPLGVVEAQTWKRILALPGAKAAGSPGAAKEAARQRALKMWPGRTDLLGLRKDHGKAEAALIAFYGGEHGLPKPAGAPLPLHPRGSAVESSKLG